MHKPLLLIALTLFIVASILSVTLPDADGAPRALLPTSEVSLTLDVSWTQTNSLGQATTSRISSSTNILTSVSLSSPTPATKPGATDLTAQHAAGAGCATINPRVTARDPLLRYVYWYYNAPAHWCWPCVGCNLNWYPQHAYFSSVTIGWGDTQPNKVANGYFYPWRGNCCSGHYSFRQGKITEFVPGVNIPIGDVFPQVELWVTGPYWTVKASRGY